MSDGHAGLSDAPVHRPTGENQTAQCVGDSCNVRPEQFLKGLTDSDYSSFWEKANKNADDNLFPGQSNKYQLPALDIYKPGAISDGSAPSRANFLQRGASESSLPNLFDPKRNSFDSGDRQDNAPSPSDKLSEKKQIEEKPKSQWEQKVSDSGAFTLDQVKEAYSTSAKDKTGLAIIIGSKDTPGSQALLEKLPDLQNENPNLKFMFVDKDIVAQKLKDNPDDANMKNWDKWIKTNLKDCNGDPVNLTLTSVQSIKSDASGRIGPDKVTSTHWTADINAGLKDQGHYAASATARNFAERAATGDTAQTTKHSTEQSVEQKKQEPLKPQEQPAQQSQPEARKPEQKKPEQKKPEWDKAEQNAELSAEKKIEAPAKTIYDGAQYKEALQEAQKHDLPVIFKVGAEWCPPCKKFDAEMGASLEDKYKGKAVVVKVDQDRHADLARSLKRSTGIPAFGVGYVDNNGNLQKTEDWTGYTSSAAWQQKVAENMSRAQTAIRKTNGR